MLRTNTVPRPTAEGPIQHHFNALKFCNTNRQLDAVQESVKATVSPAHPRYFELLAAGKNRREEINAINVNH